MARRGRIDLTHPLTDHPLNRGRALWLYGLPGWTGGGTWHDLCRRNNGTLTGLPTWTPTPYGMGLAFVATSSQYAATGYAGLHGLAGAAVAAWVKPAVWASGGGLPVSTSTAAVVGFSSHYAYTDGKAYVDTLRSSRVNNITSLYPDTSWRRVLVYHGPAGWFLFENGRQAATASYQGSVTAPTVEFGRSVTSYGHSNYWTGVVADGTAWANPTLDPAALAALDYDQSRRGYPDAIRRIRPWSFGAQAGDGRTVTAALTQAAQTSSGSITHPDLVTAALTQAAQTSSAAVNHPDLVTAALTQAANTGSAAITHPCALTAALTQAGQTASATVTHPVSLSAALTQAGQSVSSLIYHGDGPIGGELSHILLKGAT